MAWSWAGYRFDVHLGTSCTGQRHAVLTLQGLPEESVGADIDTLAGDGHGLISRLENRLAGLDRTLAARAARLDVVDGEIANARRTQHAAFPHLQALTAAREHLNGITEQLGARTTATPAATPAAGPEPEELRRPEAELASPATPPADRPAQHGRDRPGRSAPTTPTAPTR